MTGELAAVAADLLARARAGGAEFAIVDGQIAARGVPPELSDAVYEHRYAIRALLTRQQETAPPAEPSAADVLAQARAAGCELLIYEGKLALRGWATPELRAAICKHHTELVELVSKPQAEAITPAQLARAIHRPSPGRAHKHRRPCATAAVLPG